jgi:hypothetical protein
MTQSWRKPEEMHRSLKISSIFGRFAGSPSERDCGFLLGTTFVLGPINHRI